MTATGIKTLGIGKAITTHLNLKVTLASSFKTMRNDYEKYVTNSKETKK